MIPLRYRLRETVRLKPVSEGAWLVASESPLVALTVNAGAARLLEKTREGASVAEIAGCEVSGERVFHLCEYFRSRGILEVGRVEVAKDIAPQVTVIVPVKDRADDLEECLLALSRLDYPHERLEVIVVDDGSDDPAAIRRVVERGGGRLLVNEHNRGPSYSRNRAAEEAMGEILAFVDSDCVVSPAWLRELTPYFVWDRVGAVGGRTVGYHAESRLDRYEQVASPLDMGKHLRIEGRGDSTFYVPTCNLLIRRSRYRELGGLREDLTVGEDVDLCWRLRAQGCYLLYAPEGLVRHKHRSRLISMLQRRAEYGTSEAVLHALHPGKRKRFPLAPAPLATAAILSAVLVGRRLKLLPVCLVPALGDMGCRVLRLRHSGAGLPTRSVGISVLRGHMSMIYFVYFHLVRYYLVPLVAFGFIVRGLWRLIAAAVLYAGGVDYFTRKPRMGYSTYLGYYLAEHIAYQIGVAAGCIQSRTARSYLPAVYRRSPPA